MLWPYPFVFFTYRCSPFQAEDSSWSRWPSKTRLHARVSRIKMDARLPKFLEYRCTCPWATAEVYGKSGRLPPLRIPQAFGGASFPPLSGVPPPPRWHHGQKLVSGVQARQGGRGQSWRGLRLLAQGAALSHGTQGAGGAREDSGDVRRRPGTLQQVENLSGRW